MCKEGTLIFRDYCKRIVRHDDGERETFFIPRHKCSNPRFILQQAVFARNKIVNYPIQASIINITKPQLNQFRKTREIICRHGITKSLALMAIMQISAELTYLPMI
ncbi:hypothetical protein [Oribacterium sp. FC2011]|uniref:hypothetical protein n=1 Tax=Oribacterium sp. FC2011 TaxID=1408311 RepID=UPI003FA59E32